MKTLSHIIFAAVLCCSCSTRKDQSVEKVDAVYFGGNVYSIDGEFTKSEEAVAVKDGKVVYIGSRAGAEKLIGKDTELNNLSGKTFFAALLNHAK